MAEEQQGLGKTQGLTDVEQPKKRLTKIIRFLNTRATGVDIEKLILTPDEVTILKEIYGDRANFASYTDKNVLWKRVGNTDIHQPIGERTYSLPGRFKNSIYSLIEIINKPEGVSEQGILPRLERRLDKYSFTKSK
jgi:hypothetical protein